MLNLRRADFLASPAGGAAPEDIGAYGGDEIPLRIALGAGAYLLDELHGRKRLAGGIRRAAILATLAVRAGIGIEDVFPGKVADLGDPELLHPFLLPIDGGDGPLRLQGYKEVVGAGGKDMLQLRVGNDGDETQAQQQVQPPECLVSDEERRRGDVHEEEPGKQQPAGGIGGQCRILPHFGGRHAHPFDEKAGNKDRKEQGVDEVVIGNGLQPRGPDDKAPDEEPRQHESRQEGPGVELADG